jgi:hypothetical protein
MTAPERPALDGCDWPERRVTPFRAAVRLAMSNGGMAGAVEKGKL